jgi:hypothetical protein
MVNSKVAWTKENTWKKPEGSPRKKKMVLPIAIG